MRVLGKRSVGGKRSAGEGDVDDGDWTLGVRVSCRMVEGGGGASEVRVLRIPSVVSRVRR